MTGALPSGVSMFNLFSILHGPIGWKLFFYAVTLFGSMAMYVFSLNKGFNGAGDFLRRFFPGKSDVFYDRLDFVLVVVFGSIIGSIFFSPQTAFGALAAGFGWVGAANTLLTTNAARPGRLG